MRRACVAAIARKDVRMAMRNNLVLLALVSGVLFSLVYYALPSATDETYHLSVYDEGTSALFSSLPPQLSRGAAFSFVSSEEALHEAVYAGDAIAGIVIPATFDEVVAAGGVPSLSLVVADELSTGQAEALSFLVATLAGYDVYGTLPVPLATEVIGADEAGFVPMREQSVPFYLLMALMMEMWTIATLVVEESAAGTMRALLVTPARPSDVLTAKTLVGGVYAVGVVFVILLLTRSVRGDLFALFLGIVLGALLAVSLGLLLGSLTENITGSYMYVSIPLIVLLLPGLLLFIPDISHDAVRAIPTYYLVDAFGQVLNRGAGIADVWRSYLAIACLDVVFFVGGIAAIRRRYR